MKVAPSRADEGMVRGESPRRVCVPFFPHETPSSPAQSDPRLPRGTVRCSIEGWWCGECEERDPDGNGDTAVTVEVEETDHDAIVHRATCERGHDVTADVQELARERLTERRALPWGMHDPFPSYADVSDEEVFW